jgi:hypothetical protein
LGTTGVAAAVANAVYDAIGLRVRDLPICRSSVFRLGFVGEEVTQAFQKSPSAAAPVFAARDPLGSVPLRLRINGALRDVSVEPWTTLFDALRERIGLTGTKKG